jgi:hypothetical protein
LSRLQAFAAAQLNGDWSQLETEMAAVLGPEAVGLNAGGLQSPDVLLAQVTIQCNRFGPNSRTNFKKFQLQACKNLFLDIVVFKEVLIYII